MQDRSATFSAAHDIPEDTSAATPGPSSNAFDDLNRTPSESSFLPAHAAVSSTPAAAATARANSTFFTSQASVADPSWSAQVESPLVRLHRELHDFTRADPQPAASTSTDSSLSLSTPTRTRVEPPPPRPTTTTTTTTHYDEEYEEEPTLPVGMSPPVMLSFARLPTLGRSPAKSAATHIRHTLLRDALRDVGRSGSASASASVLTPPSFSRYTRGGTSASLEADPELDSLMRRVSLLPRDSQHVSSASASTASVPSYHVVPMTPPPPSSSDVVATTTPESNDGSFSSSSSSGEEDSVHNTAHPSAAFLLASRQRGRNDDDDNDDEEDDSLDADPDAATASFEPVHPFARAVAAGAEDDSFDSFDGDATETVFGARHVKRGAAPLGT